MHQTADQMGPVAAMQAAAAGRAVGRPEAGREGENRHMVGDHRGGKLDNQLARIVFADFHQPLGGFAQRLLPGNLLPAGIDADAFFRIGPPQGLGQAVGIIMGHDPGHPLAAKAAEPDDAVGIAFYLGDHPVDAVGKDGTIAVTKAARRRQPDIIG